MFLGSLDGLDGEGGRKGDNTCLAQGKAGSQRDHKGKPRVARKREMVLSTLHALIGEIVFKSGLKYWRTLVMQRWPHKQAGTAGAKAGGKAWILAEGSLCRGDGK